MVPLDALPTSHPISVKVKHPDEINEIFDRISYGKGATIIRMMYHFLGEATFVEGLTLYLNRFKYDNAEQDDLWQAYTEVFKNTNFDSLLYITFQRTLKDTMAISVVEFQAWGNKIRIFKLQRKLLC
jgi:aminopeptidase N